MYSTKSLAPAVWYLRYFVREGMVTYIQNKHPNSLPKLRVSSHFSVENDKENN